ncbi:hypothetical protein K491DRAFT_212503 [Lophiostoma macrostomum CBS 122681]|uniref:F-box domain-containing protein n=1 Tax=Lophiostoma macrostomum CBS 122681 TaxID=1314788 RepID=A0A6A6SNL8_9PLEO|nr:hypothetical protein K491DRAFT_212503 [Lophiostoma macrostomum CBS 122681]
MELSKLPNPNISDSMATNTKPPSLLKLPNELLEKVVEYASPAVLPRDPDKPHEYRQRQMIPMALTCRQLRDVTELCMYRTIFYRSREHVTHDTGLLRLHRTLRNRKDLAQHVCSLDLIMIDREITFTPSKARKDTGNGFPQIPESRFLGLMLTCLPALLHLSLAVINTWFGVIPGGTLANLSMDHIFGKSVGRGFSASMSLEPYLQNVRTLEIYGCVLPPQFLTLPKLDSLSMGPSVQLVEDSKLEDMPNLKSLHIGQDASSLQPPDALSRDTVKLVSKFTSLRRLSIELEMLFNLEFLGNPINYASYAVLEVLAACQATLEVLSLNHANGCPAIFYPRVRPIRSLSNLKHLKILDVPREVFTYMNNELQPEFIPITTFLPPNIETITISGLDIYTLVWLDNLLLVKECFQNLRHINLSFFKFGSIAHNGFVAAEREQDVFKRMNDAGITVSVQERASEVSRRSW